MEDYIATYTTIEQVYREINKNGINAYMIGGISSAIQAGIDLYRQNEDIDLMVAKEDLPQLMESLRRIGYNVEDKRGYLTGNYVDADRTFHPVDHELNADSNSPNMLGIGIFVFERKDGTVITNSYAYEENAQAVIGTQSIMPEELFDLMYSSEQIEYKGTPVKCQSKEFTYLSKLSGNREKDKLDASVIKQYIGEDEQKKIARIRKLQKRIVRYRNTYDKSGNIVSSEKMPGMEDKISSFISKIVAQNSGLSNEELKEVIFSNETVKNYIERDEDIRNIMTIIRNSSIEGNLVEISRQIAHDYLWNDETLEENKFFSTQKIGKEFKIPTDKLQMLNSFVDENLRNRRNSTDYDLLHMVSEMMANGVHIKDRHTSQITKPFSEEQTKDVALQFFKGLDQDLYVRVNNILEGKSGFAFNMYQLSEVEDFSKTKDDGLPVHTKTACVMSKNGKSAIYVPCKGTIEDIYLLVHELSHTFDFIEYDNPTRNLMGEITPLCFEAMLSQYLLENGIATREDVVNREKGSSISHFDDGVETFAKLELMRIKEQHGEIKQEAIIQLQRKYGITNGRLDFVLGRLTHSEPNVDYRARYMIAQLVYPHYMKQYKQNPQKAIQTLKDYFEQIKDNNMAGSLETLGINPSVDCIPGLIQECNDRLQNLEQTRLFSIEEIDKGIGNTPTMKKDESKKKVQSDEKSLEEIIVTKY